MDKEIKIEQQQLNETIGKIEDNSYYVWDLIEKKSDEIRGGYNLKGNDIKYRSGKKEQSSLMSVKSQPYFGRFDVVSEDGEESFYIGKHGIRDKSEDLIVVDWRMPLASVYYNFTPGKSKQSYDVEDPKTFRKETFKVDVTRKREFTIKNKKLFKMIQQVATERSDLNVTYTEGGEELTITDDFLKDILEQGETTGYLKEIIATIQKEQDYAIRQPLNTNVIIQGVAGSGKSSIALHRLSFLLFNNKQLKPEDVLILGPSNLFISSFKGLLPDLNLEGIKQSTFQQMALNYLKPVMKEKVDLTYQYYFEEILYPEDLDSEREIIEFKGSELFVMLLEVFIDEIKRQYEDRFKPIVIIGQRLSSEDLKKFYDGYDYLPFINKVEKFVLHVESYFNEKLKIIVKELDEQHDFVINNYLKNSGLTNEKYIELVSVMSQIREHKRNNFNMELKKEISIWKKDMKIPTIEQIYRQVLSYEMLNAYSREVGNEIPKLFIKHEHKILNYFDIAPVLYIYILLYGTPNQFTHTVIDEGQDFSIMHYAVLKKLTKTMTILGDKDQSIFMGYGQDNWEDLIDNFLDRKQDSILTLETSYRSTKQIIDVANLVLQNQYGSMHRDITPINRSGPDVSFTEVSSGKDLLQGILNTIKEWTKKYNRIAIIHKDEQKAIRLTEYLNKNTDEKVTYVNPEEEVSQDTISVLASYFCKGMEFDAVILVNINEENFPKDDLHARLLYVLLTRSQQEVKVFYQDTPSLLLDGLIKEDQKVVSKYDDIL